MAAITLGSVIISTADKPRLVAFYRDVLGLAAVSPGKVQSAGIIIHPARHSAIAGPPAEPHRIMLTFETPDIRAAAADLQARGVIFVRPPQQEAWGGWVATFRDPDGNYLQLMQVAPDAQ